MSENDTHTPPVINSDAPLVTITGNPRAFRNEDDLTPETYAAVCLLLEHACDGQGLRHQRPWRAAAEAISRLGGAATRAGWDDSAVIRLEAAAGTIYARLISEVAEALDA